MRKIKLVLSFFLFLNTLASAQQPFAVVELFTSEGCISCPPAEQILTELKSEAEKNKQNIFFLEYHVDYWNRLGWKDPFSKNQFTLRQENYSRVLPGKELYTPQMIVNGETQFTGSERLTAKAMIQKAIVTPAVGSIQIESKEIVNDTLIVHYRSARSDKNSSVKIVITEDNLEMNVLKGENEGKKLHHDAVVRIFYSSPSTELKGKVKIPLKQFVPKPGMQLIAFVQHKQSMKITSVASTSF